MVDALLLQDNAVVENKAWELLKISIIILPFKGISLVILNLKRNEESEFNTVDPLTIDVETIFPKEETYTIPLNNSSTLLKIKRIF